MYVRSVFCFFTLLLSSQLDASFCHKPDNCPDKLERIITVKTGEEEFCKSLLNDGVMHIDYTLPVEIDDFWNKKVFEQAEKYGALVDINNDQISDLIVPVNLSSSSNRSPCESRRIIVVNRPKVILETLGLDYLLDLNSALDVNQCSQYSDAVQINDSIYIEKRENVKVAEDGDRWWQQVVVGYYSYSGLDVIPLCEYSFILDDETRQRYEESLKKTLSDRSARYGQCVNEPVIYSLEKRREYCRKAFGNDAKEFWEKNN